MRARSIICLMAFFLTIGFLLVLGSSEVEAQLRKAKRSSNNKRMGNYRGGAINFKKDKRYLSAGININSTNYLGDITPTASLTSTDFSATRMGAGATVTYRMWPNISFGGALNWNRLYGNDFSSDFMDNQSGIYRYHRNLHFRNDIMEFSGYGILDLLPNRGTYFIRPPLIPYVYSGLAVYYHNPKALAPATDLSGNPLAESGKWVALKPLGTEGQNSGEYNVSSYSNIQIALPIGVGVRYKLSNHVDFEFEIGYRILFTDYIDDVSKDYIDLGALDTDLAKAMSFRSLEPIAAVSGENRMLSTATYAVTSRFDGNSYNVLTGYGHDNIKNNRGNPKDNDHYIVTSLKIKYILHGKFRKAKFR